MHKVFFQILQRYLPAILPARPSILAQQITADFQLTQEVWDHLSKQLNEISETD